MDYSDKECPSCHSTFISSKQADNTIRYHCEKCGYNWDNAKCSLCNFEWNNRVLFPVEWPACKRHDWWKK